MGDVNPRAAADAETEGLAVDDPHVVRVVVGDTTDRRLRDLVADEKLIFLHRVRTRWLRGRRRTVGAGSKHRPSDQERNATHLDLLKHFACVPKSASDHERKLSFAALRRANSSTSVERTKGLVSRSCATVVGIVISPASRCA